MSIIVYTKAGCGWCAEVLELLREKNVHFEEREVYGNRAYFDELVQKSGQKRAPTLDIDGKILADTDAAHVREYLKI